MDSGVAITLSPGGSTMQRAAGQDLLMSSKFITTFIPVSGLTSSSGMQRILMAMNEHQ